MKVMGSSENLRKKLVTEDMVSGAEHVEVVISSAPRWGAGNHHMEGGWWPSMLKKTNRVVPTRSSGVLDSADSMKIVDNVCKMSSRQKEREAGEIHQPHLVTSHCK